MLSHADECLLRQSMHLTLSSETEEIARIEADSYPADEKATPEGVVMRQKEAGEFFWTLGPVEGLATSDVIQPVWGFINGTCTSHNEVTEESMETHEPDGSTLIIHSVVIHPDHRRKGLATAMLSYYLERMCFKVLRLSPVVHGQDPWFELSMNLIEKRRGIQYHVDAFATQPYTGNQAAVVFKHYSEREMQQLAAENNFAETAFVERIFSDSNSIMDVPEFYIRWFTPSAEIELCGHATVATAHALVERGLFESRLVKSEETSLVGSIIFKTKCRGSLTTNVLKTDNSTVIYELNFPSSRPTAKPLSTEDREHLCSSLRITSDDIIFEGQGIDDIVIELKPEAFHQVPTCSSGLIDFNRLNSVSTPRGVIITCTGPSDHNADFLSRFYCPKFGIDEDPVTGSAHTSLAPYWCSKLSSDKLRGYQMSERGGYVSVEMVPLSDDHSNDTERVLLRGHAVTVMSSILHHL